MMSEKFDFYQDHSLRFLEMALTSEYTEMPAKASGYGFKRGDCGDAVEMAVVVEDGKLSGVAFGTDGCLNTRACGSCVAHLSIGKAVEDAWDISPEKVADFLETLPEGHFHCAELAVGAFFLALADFQRTGGKSWQRLYRSRLK
ncbi:MAG: iron-sulfur cluster assembly scaffold protein [Pseudomonadota bacterium]